MMSKLQHKALSQLFTYRWLLIFILILRGVLTLCFIFPFITSENKSRKIKVWSHALLKILNVYIEVKGITDLPSTPFLMVSNHISWFDIHLLNAHHPISFVAKSEVAGWLIFGWMAKQLGTLFIRRDDLKHAKKVVEEVAIALDQRSICIFPEGTSTAGDKVLSFKPLLFQAAIQAKVPVYPVALAYFCKETGLRSQAAAFIGDMGLLESVGNILKSRGLKVTLTFLPPVDSFMGTPSDRKWLSQHCYDCISHEIIQVSGV
jgi:1-acyl-sn-glycerol-3-phosphate acyltransferase